MRPNILEYSTTFFESVRIAVLVYFFVNDEDGEEIIILIKAHPRRGLKN